MRTVRSIACAWFSVACLASAVWVAQARADCGDAAIDGGEPCADADGDGIGSAQEVRDGDKRGHDVDGDGVLNQFDTDSDGDAIPDRFEHGDHDHDGVPDYLEPNAIALKGGGGASCSLHAARTADLGPWLAWVLGAIALIRRRRSRS